MKVINLAQKLQDGTLQTPEMCLQECLDTDIGKRGAFENAKKIIIIALDDTNDEYSVSWCQAGMKMSEMLALIEITKACFKRDMGY